MHAFSYLITLIMTEVTTPLITALNLLPLLDYSIDNGVFVFTISELIASGLSLGIFFAFAFLPIYIIKIVKGLIK